MGYMKTNTAVIGGGASGLTAAVGCSRLSGKGSVLIIEKQQRTGRKLLASGNGRCNITNSGISEKRYHGDKEIIRSVLSGHSYEDMCVFMRSLGVLLREESEGRVYPYSNQASTILDALRNECERLGAEELCGFDIKQVKKEKGGFLIISDDTDIFAKNVIFASGSQASPSLGSDGSGYKLLEALGIGHTPLFPALSPVSTKEKYKELKGVRTKGRVSLFADGNIIQSTEGEIQFTDSGISGICVFELSRAVNEFFALGTVCGSEYKNISITADIMSGFSFAELCDYLGKWAEGKTATPYGDVRNTIVAVFHDLGQARSICSRTVFLKNKTILADGPSSEVITPGMLEEVFDFDVAGYIERQVIAR